MYKYYNTLWRGPNGYARQFLRIMKILFILMTAFLVQVSASTYAQKITLKEREASLTSIFEKINKQSGIDFLVSNNVLDIAKLVSIDVKNEELAKVLDKIFEGQPLDYEVKDKAVIVRKKTPSFLDRLAERLAAIDVRGRVVDEKGEPLAGATVKVKGTNHTSTTDAQGKFYLPDVSEDGMLEVSYIGFIIQDVKVASELTVVLKIAIGELQEVTINKGYYSENKRLSTGSTVKITAEDIAKQPVNNPLLALQGRMSGVEVTQASGMPGSAVSVVIRGRNSLRNTTDQTNLSPLYLIDGIQFGNQPMGLGRESYGGMYSSPFSSLNPSDIESIVVLKDADATAIYGSRGANGVVLITTKKGKAGQTRINVDIKHGVGDVAKRMELLNRRQYLDIRREAFVNDGLNPTNPNVSAALKKDIMMWDTTRYTDWQKELLGGNAALTNINASVAGGSSSTQFFISSGYSRETTVFPGSNANVKGSVNFNINHRSENQKFFNGIHINYVSDQSNITAEDLTNEALTLSPVAPALRNADGSINMSNGFVSGASQNPLLAFEKPAKVESENLLINGQVGYNLLKSLSIKVQYGLSSLHTNERVLLPISLQNPVNNPVGTSSFSSGSVKNWNIEPQIEYKNTLGKHNLSVLVGSTFQQNLHDLRQVVAYGFTDDRFLEDIISAPTIFPAGSTYYKYRYTSIFGRVNYNYKDTYLVNFTGRRDGSSRFGPNKRFGNFGALGTAWIFSNEDILGKALSFLSLGKLRASYGITGSDNIPDYGFYGNYISSPTYAQQGAIVPSNLFNADYSWETNKKLEVGLDLNFFKDRIQISTNYYKNRSSNQLVGTSLSTVTGFDNLPFFNFPAVVQNAGIELDISTTNVGGDQFQWRSSFNLTIPKNKLVSFDNIDQYPAYADTYAVGKSLRNSGNLFHYTGVDSQTGLYTFEDVNGDGILNEKDRYIRFDTGRGLELGFQNSIIYGGFQLDVLFQYVDQLNRNIHSSTGTSTFSRQPGTISNFHIGVLDNWKTPGDLKDIQRYSQNSLAAVDARMNLSFSDRGISDASFLRLKNISLSYTIPTKWLTAAKLSKCNFFVQGQNLFTVTKYEGLDPENLGFGNLPALRIITAGLNITL